MTKNEKYEKIIQTRIIVNNIICLSSMPRGEKGFDAEKAFQGVLEAGEGGDAIAQYVLGHSNKLDNKQKLSFEWFKKAADQGYLISHQLVGAMYMGGHGVEHDKEEAVKWIGSAASNGASEAVKMLKHLTTNAGYRPYITKEMTKHIVW